MSTMTMTTTTTTTMTTTRIDTMTTARLTARLPLAALLALGASCTSLPADGSLGAIEADPAPEAAAGSLSSVHGRVAPGGDAAILAHEGAGPAAEVRVLDRSGGAATVVGQGPVAPDGSFSVDVPAGARRLVVAAVDADGDVAAAGLLDASAPAGAVAEMAPLGGESTLEAETAMALADCITMNLVDTVDLQARLSELVATTALSAIEAGAAAEDLENRLAQAIGVAQATQLAALAGEGVPVSRQALFEAGVPAATQMHSDLAGGADPTEAAAAFAAALQEARGGLVGARPNARSEVASAVAFGAAAEEEEGGLAGQFEEIDAVIDALLISAVAPLGLEGVVVALDDIMDPPTDAILEQLDELIDTLGLAGAEGSVDEVVGTLTGLLDGLVGDGGLLSLLDLGGLLGGGFRDDVVAMAEAGRTELDLAVSTATEVAVAAADAAGQCVDFGSLGGEVAEASSQSSADLHGAAIERAHHILIGRPSDHDVGIMAEMLSLVEGLQSVEL